jgi:hypothetical protein
MTDRGHWLAAIRVSLNMRRLMYQTLMCGGAGLGAPGVVLGDQAGCLRAAFDAENVQRAVDALIDGVRRDVELGGDFLGIEVLVDQAQAIELARREAGNAGFAESSCSEPCGPATPLDTPSSFQTLAFSDSEIAESVET